MDKEEIVISGIHMDLTAAIKNIVKEKAGKLIRHSDQILGIKVELESHENKPKQPEFIAKGHIRAKGPDMIVQATTDDLYKSIEELMRKLDRKLRRRSRLMKVKRKSKKAVEIPAAIPKTA